ncbi:MAG: hypothetical protein COB69_01730 [Phycisphaera sp.]|nr:MAG: hypothetical protein COB69_01730 [Phycisphaera sp.]
MDENTGTTAGDSKGSNNGTLTSGPTWVTGKVSQSYDIEFVEAPTEFQVANFENWIGQPWPSE